MCIWALRRYIVGTDGEGCLDLVSLLRAGFRSDIDLRDHLMMTCGFSLFPKITSPSGLSFTRTVKPRMPKAYMIMGTRPD